MVLLQTGQIQAWSNGAYADSDPTGLTLVVYDGTGTPTSHTYPGGDGTIVRDSTGNFHAAIEVTNPGIWRVIWQATGAVQGVWQDSFDVQNPVT